MEAWADFITSAVWSMLMFQVAWRRMDKEEREFSGDMKKDGRFMLWLF